jgi:hypothetical protein
MRRQWEVLKPDIFACIMDFYNSGQPLIMEGATGLSGAGTLIEPPQQRPLVSCFRVSDSVARPLRLSVRGR